MSCEQETDDLEVNNKTWNKLYDNAKKSGYRDGVSDGKDLNFQNSFDDGYREGFKNGFILGLYKGTLSKIKENSLDDDLQKVSRGNCEICKNKLLENNTTADLILIQDNSTNDVLNKLQNRYSDIKHLPNKLN